MKAVAGMILLLSPLLAAEAGGVLKISGKLVSITTTEYIVKTELGNFAVERAAVEPKAAKKIERPEIPVTFTVPFAAVRKAKPFRQ